MAGESRRPAASLKSDLFEKTSRFEFFQAVRLLHKLHPERAGVGGDDDPQREVLHFRSDLSYAFPTGDLRALEAGEDDAPDRLTVNFLGIATPASFGSLPTPYVEELRTQERARNPALRDFFDLFNHRLVSLFYRAWERSRMDVLHDLRKHSPFESALLAVIGLEGRGLLDRLPFDGLQLLSRAGLLGMRPAPASALEGLIESFFGVRARVEQFWPHWYEIEESDRTRLGLANSTLGHDVNLGREVCLSQSRFRIRLGPMDFELYQELLPDRPAFATVSSLVRLACGPDFDFDFSLALRGAEVPALHLAGGDGQREERAPCRLGWSSWLSTRRLERDVDDAVFTPSLEREERGDFLETRT